MVPVARHIEPECARGLAELEVRGYQVRRLHGFSAIDQARNEMAAAALADGFDELLWIDSDIGFAVESVEMLRAHQLPVVCGIYARKGQRVLACHVRPGTERVVFGVGGGLLEIQYAATGFLLCRREVYEKVGADLPVCNEIHGAPIVPYFLPMVIPDGQGGQWYIGEDFAFCERARRCGFSIMADTRIRLQHIGRYSYSWEDAGSDRPRYTTYNFDVWR